MSAKDRVSKTVVKIFNAASANIRSKGDIRWSTTKKKFVKANNKTVATEDQVRQFYTTHPDRTNWERATIHIGQGANLPIPMDMLPDTTATAQVDVDRLMARIDDYQAGTDRNVQSMLDQTQKVLDRLDPVEQTLGSLQHGLTQANQDVSANLDEIKVAIRQVEAHYQELKDRFGQTEQQLADAVAFDREFTQKLDSLQQRLDELQGLKDEILRLQSEGVFNPTLIAIDQPGIGEVVFLSLVALLVGIVVTAFAIRDEGQWLNIPDIVWGIIAVTIVFLFFFIISWSQAERNERIRLEGGS